jgi:hypothetical protein
MFSLALPTNGSDTGDCTWSTPITVSYPGQPELFVSIPVTDAWVSKSLKRPLDAPTCSPCGKQPSKASKTLLVSRHEVARASGTELRERTVVVLHMSMQVRSGTCRQCDTSSVRTACRRAEEHRAFENVLSAPAQV